MLVGPNGSGKSNFLDALRLTSQGLSENLDNALRERGGVNEVRRRSRGHPTSFTVEVTFRSNGYSGCYRYKIGAAKGGEYRVTHEDCEVHATSHSAEVHYFHVRDGQLVRHSEQQQVMPRVADDRLYLVSMSGHEAFRPVFDGLTAVNVYSLNPDAMRHPQQPDAGDLLKRDGSNIASVLERLRKESPPDKRRIEQYLSQVVEGVTEVNRHGVGAWETVEFRQRVAGDASPWTFQPMSMSDGTLRALGVLVALFAGSPSFASPVGIEEPEVALHPAAAGLLLEALRDASASRQVLVTTHSPDLLEAPSVRADELLAVRAYGGKTLINRVDSAAREALGTSLYTPGELLRVDQLAPDPAMPQQLELFS